MNKRIIGHVECNKYTVADIKYQDGFIWFADNRHMIAKKNNEDIYDLLYKYNLKLKHHTKFEARIAKILFKDLRKIREHHLII